MEIEYIRIKRLNPEREKAYVIELDAIGCHFIPMGLLLFFSHSNFKFLRTQFLLFRLDEVFEYSH